MSFLDSTRSRAIAAAFVAFVVGLSVAFVLAADDGDSEPAQTTVAAPSASDGPRQEQPPAGQGPADEPIPVPRDSGSEEEGPSGPLPESTDEVAAAEAVRAYVTALNDRSGGRVCRAFAGGTIEGIEFPDPRESCAETVEASLGFGDQRGMPVWKSSQVTEDISAQVTGDEARVTATVFTKYADNREPTIEDDVVYLRRDGARWVLVQPSATLYRAVGAEPPPAAFAPPG